MTVRRCLWHVVVPLAIGSSVYVLWRPDNLVVFDWIRLVGLSNVVSTLRETVAPWPPPSFVLFSLPAGLWAYSFAAAMGLVFEGESRSVVASAMLIGPVMGIGSELAQAIGAVPGLFDALDLGAYTLGGALAWVGTRQGVMGSEL